MAIDPVGLLLIRAWVEHGAKHPLRAQIKLTCDTRLGYERELTLSEPSEAEAVVHAWLEDILSDSR